jgi:signal transduction histidine kinase
MQEQENDNRKTHQVALLQKIIRTDEKEREEISYELHENIAQLLAAVRLHLNIAKKHMNNEGLKYLQEAESIISKSLQGIRTLAKSISPMTLKSVGFKFLIDELFILLIEQKEIEYHLAIDENALSDTPLQIQNLFYQIAQLLLIHILKLADVSKVILTVVPLGKKLKMKIQYDGTEEMDQGPLSIPGFLLLKEKTEAFDGTFHIVENPGQQGITLEVIL